MSCRVTGMVSRVAHLVFGVGESMMADASGHVRKVNHHRQWCPILWVLPKCGGRIMSRKASQVSRSLHGLSFPHPLPVGKEWGNRAYIIDSPRSKKKDLGHPPLNRFIAIYQRPSRAAFWAIILGSGPSLLSNGVSINKTTPAPHAQ